MALGEVKVQGGVGSARRDTKDKRARVQAFYVHIGVHGMEDGTPLKGWLGLAGDETLLKESHAAWIACASCPWKDGWGTRRPSFSR